MPLTALPHHRRMLPSALSDPAMREAARLPSLQAPRLRLRWLDEADLDALYGLFSDPQALRYWSRPPFGSRDDASIYLESIHRGFQDGTLFQWGIVRRGESTVIGTCTLAGLCAQNRRAQVGFILARRHWGQGYAQEALCALLDHAFSELGLRRLEADVDPRNAASLRTLERMGFKREGYLRQRWEVGGELQDSVLLGLLASDWAMRGPQPYPR